MQITVTTVIAMVIRIAWAMRMALTIEPVVPPSPKGGTSSVVAETGSGVGQTEAPTQCMRHAKLLLLIVQTFVDYSRLQYLCLTGRQQNVLVSAMLSMQLGLLSVV